jgi:hypothetical protein
MLASIRSFFGNSQPLAGVDPDAGAVVDPGQPSRALSVSVASRARSQSPEWMLIAEHDLPRDLADDLSSIRPDAGIKGKIKAIAEGHAHMTLHPGRYAFLKRSGVRVWEFWCSMRKRAGCQYRMKVEVEEGRARVFTMRCHNEHVTTGRERGLSQVVKDIIATQLVVKKPLALLQKLHQLGHKDVKLKTLQRYCINAGTKLRKEHFANTVFSWRQYVASLPQQITTATDNEVICAWYYPDPFHIVFTTKRLIQIAIENRRYHPALKAADTTYKISCEGHPILLIGTILWDQSFVPTGIQMAAKETEVEFCSFEMALREQMQKLAPKHSQDGDLSHAIPYMMGDSAAAIKNGEQTVNGDEHDEEKMLTCYFHMKNSKGFNTKVAEETVRKAIKADLRLLHLLPYKFTAAFDYLVELWKTKWRDRGQSQMVEWFTTHWLGRNRRWSRAFTPVGLPSTNNGLERHNRTIKDVIQARHGPTGAVQELANYLASWSAQTKPHAIPRGPVDVGNAKGEKLWKAVQVRTSSSTSTDHYHAVTT